jgi:predicted transcriptional regulator
MELYMDLLQAVEKGQQSPNRISLSARLSYDRVIRFLTFLEDQKLVDRIDGKKRYRLNPRGVNVLRLFNDI